MTISEAFDYTIRAKRRNGGKKGKPAAVKTIRNYVSAKNNLLDAIPDIPIQIFTKVHAEQWKDYMIGNGMQPSAIARYISCLKAVLDYLGDSMGMDVLDPSKVKRVRVEGNSNRTWLLPSEVQAMRDVAKNPRDKSMVSLLFSLGCRPEELTNLNRVDVVTDEVIIRNEKTGKDYPRFIAPYARKDLNEYLATRHDNLTPLFISGQRRRITVSRVEQIFHEVADLAKQEYPEAWEKDKNVTPYVMRHSHATDLRINGASLMDIKDALGHTTITSTQIYAHAPDQRRREVHERFHTKLK